MKIIIYPGSFDPVTNGHIDIIIRAARLCDKLIVAVANNESKKAVFSLEERVELLKRSLAGMENVEVTSFTGLLSEFVKKNKASAIIKGLRTVSDYEYELQMALINKSLSPEVETLFLVADIKYSFLSSSIVRELAKLGGNIEGLVPDCIKETVIKKLGNN